MKTMVGFSIIFWIWVAVPAIVAEFDENKKIENNFIDWFESNGGILNGIELDHFEHMGRGVKASNDLKTDDVIISVPLKICMSKMTASKTSSNTINNMFKSLQNDEDAIALFLLRERALGDQSTWAPYLKTLPQSIPQGAYFDQYALQALGDPFLAAKLKDRGESIKTRHKKLGPQLHVLKNFIKSQSNNQNENSQEEKAKEMIQLSSYEWALSIVSSRALTFRGERFLAPMCDMFNYSPHPLQRAQESGVFYLRHHILDKQSTLTLTVTADRQTEKGQQVFEDYGDNPSSLYLDHHGFVPLNNPFDCVNVNLKISTNSSVNKLKQTLIEKMRISTSSTLSSCLLLPSSSSSLLLDEQDDTKGTSSSSLSDFGISADVWNWLTVHFELSDSVLEKCVQLLERHAAGEDRAELMEEVRAGACDLLSGGPKPPLDWSPSTNLLSDIILPALLSRQEALLQSQPNFVEVEEKDNVDMKLAISYRKSQEFLLMKLIEYTNNIISLSNMNEVEVDSSGLLTAQPNENKEMNENEESTTWTDHSDCKDTDSNDSFLCAIAVFNTWIKNKKFPIQKIEAQQVPGMRVGTLAIESIEEEELYLAVPAHAVMDISSAQASEPLIQSGLFSLLRKSGDNDFYTLLFHLLYEYTVLGTQSEWWPYLRLLPTLDEIKPPAEYSAAEVALLKGSQVQDSILNYKAEILKRWNVVRDKSFLGPASHTLFPTLKEEQFRWAHYILDSRSIWWNNKRHLVPLLDLINCGEGDWREKGRNSPNRVHSTKPAKHGKVETADTYASQAVAVGEQLFENYGQPNNIYLQYHGFVLDENSHDCVAVSIPIIAGDEGMEDVKNLRKRMKQYGFSSGVQTFCIANPTTVKKAIDAAKQSNLPVNWQMLGDGRFLTWIALKFGRSIGSDIRVPFKEVVAQLLEKYPSPQPNDINSHQHHDEFEAGEGIGGGKGLNHPARKLIRQEIKLLNNLYDIL